jgi:hypothetical protein
MKSMSSELRVSKRVGRPRIHQTSTAKSNASRAARGLKKVTVDVPICTELELRAYAAELRRRGS